MNNRHTNGWSVIEINNITLILSNREMTRSQPPRHQTHNTLSQAFGNVRQCKHIRIVTRMLWRRIKNSYCRLIKQKSDFKPGSRPVLLAVWFMTCFFHTYVSLFSLYFLFHARSKPNYVFFVFNLRRLGTSRSVTELRGLARSATQFIRKRRRGCFGMANGLIRFSFFYFTHMTNISV